MAKRTMHNLARQRLATTIMQAGFRGSKARSWVKVWRRKREYHIPRCQSMVRRRFERIKWERILLTMHTSATCIQKSVRRFLARRLIHRLRRNNAALSIQMFHRMTMLRIRVLYRFDRKSAVVIQTAMRSKLARASVANRSIEMNDAAIQIQKCWKGHLARVLRSDILTSKCSVELRHHVLMLGTEIEYYKTDLQKMEEKSRDEELLIEVEDAKKAYAETTMNLSTSAQNSIELTRMKANMTPASVAEGWEDQVDQSLRYERTMETEMKMDIVLNLGMHLKLSQRKLKESKAKTKSLEERIGKLQKERRTLRDRLQGYERERSKREAALNHRKAIADEKRKWKIVHRTASGKPRKSNTLTLSQQISLGTANLFAEDEVSSDPKERIMNMIELRSYVAQVEHLKGIFSQLF